MSDEQTKHVHVTTFACGTSNKTCRCNCSSGERDCEHKWDGPTVGLDRNGFSVTCSRCGMAAYDHDLWVLP